MPGTPSYVCWQSGSIILVFLHRFVTGNLPKFYLNPKSVFFSHLGLRDVRSFETFSSFFNPRRSGLIFPKVVKYMSVYSIFINSVQGSRNVSLLFMVPEILSAFWYTYLSVQSFQMVFVRTTPRYSIGFCFPGPSSYLPCSYSKVIHRHKGILLLQENILLYSFILTFQEMRFFVLIFFVMHMIYDFLWSYRLPLLF